MGPPPYYSHLSMQKMLSLIASVLLFAACGEKAPVPAPAAPEISFASAELTLDPKGGETTLRVSATAAWTVETDGQDWFALASAAQVYKGESLLKVTAQPNMGGKPRQGALRFTSGDREETLVVRQEPCVFVPEGYRLVWQDEFSGTSDDLKAKWRFEDWAPGRVNHELQRYTPDDRRTSFVEDGALHIVARKEGAQVISARMNTRGSWCYGYMEAAIWLPEGKGTWPAFWMMPDDMSRGWPACGEIDIMEEVGVNANYTSSSIHCQDYNHVKGTQKTAERLTPGAESGYHVYGLEWTEDCIRTFVDGKQLLEFKNDQAGNDNTWPFNKKFFITLNLAWGGDWGGWNGVDESALPCTMRVDYVRVYQK